MRVKAKFLSGGGHQSDYVLLSAVFIVVIFGLIMLSSASFDLGKMKFNDTYYYLKRQLVYGFGLGLAGFSLGFFLPYKKWRPLALPLLLLSVLLLILVFTPLGFKAGGASRWLNLGPILFQPAELLKITFIIYLAAWLSNRKIGRGTGFVEDFLPFLIVVGIVAVLIVLQPATTILVVILLSGLIVYFTAGSKIRYLVLAGLIGLIGLAAVVASSPYRLERVKTYFLPEQADVQGSGYHQSQAQIAIGSGGIFGVGYGNSNTKYRFLPEPIGDSIFAVIAEEFGFIGSIILIIFFAVIFHRGFLIAKNSRDQFGRLLAIGFISVIAIQTFINLGAISGLLPLTGVPLPFISYGSSALAVFLTMAGIIGNISKYT